MRHTNSHGKHGPAADVSSYLRAALRAEAQRHHPDSAAMLARVRRAAGTGVPVSPGRRRTSRRAWVAVAAGAALVAAGGGWVVAEHPAPRHARTAPLAETSPRSVLSTTRSSGGGGAANARSATPTSPPTTVRPSPTATATPSSANFLLVKGSVYAYDTAYWSQSAITLTSTKTLASLTVVMRLAHTPGLKSDGAWTSAPNNWITITVTPGHGMLVYTFTLDAGATLPAGTYVFTGQYSYNSGQRNPDTDTWLAIASASAGSGTAGTGTAGTATAREYGTFLTSS